MKPRLVSVFLVGCLFALIGGFTIARGLLALAHDVTSPNGPPSASTDALWTLGSGALAALGGVFLMRDIAWGRWLCAVWMGGHLLLSLMHSPAQLLVHALLFALIVFVLWRPKARAHFQESA